MKEVHELLTRIQQNLVAPKGQTNAFGKYKYRSCEDIIEAVKPLLEDGFLLIGDEMVMLGDRFYVKATAKLFKGEHFIYSEAFAREAEEKKGMDVAQITGATSSYARKYALNGLFAIDDTKDADTKDNSEPVHRFKSGEKEEIYKSVRECLDNGDEHGLKEIMSEYEGPDEKMKVWSIFNSSEKAAIKELMK